jgi:hypothetical protein
MRKGQMEFVVIIGIILVVVIVAVVALRGGSLLPNPVPQGVYEEQREVSESIKGITRNAADQALRTIMLHGGYLDDDTVSNVVIDDVPNVKFMLRDVAYWQQCSSTMYPDLRDIRTWIEASIRKDLLEGLDYLELLYGNRTEFDRSGLIVDVNVLGVNAFEPDMVEVTVRLPTSVRGYGLPGDLYPYKVWIDSKFGRIYAFARDFSDASASERYFDTFTIAAIYFSQSLEGTHVKLPTFGVLTNCGEILHRSPNDINRYLLESVEYVMAATNWWELMPVDFSQPKAFAIQDLGGSRYPDLEIQSLLVDDFMFSTSDSVFVTNFRMPKHGPFSIPVCTEVYNKGYDFSYPFVLRIRDPYTGYYFNFASMVGVQDRGDGPMEPGECGISQEPTAACDMLHCYGSVKVTDSSGMPLQGAFVSYQDCPLGETGPAGIVQGPVACGTGEMYVYHSKEYEFLTRIVGSSELNQTFAVVLNPVRSITVHFREVDIGRSGFYMTQDMITGDPVRNDIDCKACPGQCRIQTETLQDCRISTVERGHAFADFDNDRMLLPVTNVVDIPTGCRDNRTECERCDELMVGIEEETDLDVLDEARDVCRACALACLGSTADSVNVDYLTLGYEYDVDARMHDPANDFWITGGFKDSFNLETNVTELYVYIPRRSGDREFHEEFNMEDPEKECLAEALKSCGIEPVSPGPYPTRALVVHSGSSACSELEAISDEYGLGLGSYFCICPEGGTCGSCSEPDCGTCCTQDAREVAGIMEPLLESRGVKIIYRE